MALAVETYPGKSAQKTRSLPFCTGARGETLEREGRGGCSAAFSSVVAFQSAMLRGAPRKSKNGPLGTVLFKVRIKKASRLCS